MILFKKQLFDLEVKSQGPTKVIMVCDTLPYGHAPTYQLSLTYLEWQKCYGPGKKILFKKQLFDLEVKVPWRSLRYATHRLMVMHIRTICSWSLVGFVWIIWPWGQRSRSHKGHYGTRHTTLWYAPTNQLSLTYLERQKCYGLDKKILSKKQVFDLEVRGQSPTKVNTVRDTPPYVHAPTYEISLTYLERVMVWTSFAVKKQKKWKKRKKKKKSD